MNRICTGRDPFARHTIRKRKVRIPPTGRGCKWCGGACTSPRGPYLWQYYVDADSARESGDIDGLFCSLGCLNTFRN